MPVLGELAGKHAVMAAAGGAHTVVVTEDGALYAFGRRGVNGIDGGRDVVRCQLLAWCLLLAAAAGWLDALDCWLHAGCSRS